MSAPLEVGGEVDAAGGDEVHTSKGGVRWGVTGFSLIAAHPSSSSGGVGRCVGGGADNTRRCLPPADQYGGGERSDVSSAAH